MSGIYVHIPFCMQKCLYCDFISYAGQSEHIGAYIDALSIEMQARAGERDWGVFQTVFIGGGTPSLLSGKEMHRLLQLLRTSFQIAEDAEISVECNPGTLSLEKLIAYREAGINRLSIGIQSLENRILVKIGRTHNPCHALQSLQFAREAGFYNINADIIYGLPDQTELDYLSTLRDILAFSPVHISAYSLILEEDTPLYTAVSDDSLLIPSEDEMAIMQEIGTAFLSTHAMHRYEISNYSKEGFACLHNLNYWNNGAYLGLGVGAHSAWRLKGKNGECWTRWENGKALQNYISQPYRSLADMPLIKISLEEEALETVMLGLRLLDGMDLAAFEKRFHRAFANFYPQTIEKLVSSRLLEIMQNKARLTPRGLDLQNTVLQYFLNERPY